MDKIALICQYGASTGLCVKKMQEYAAQENIDVEIAAYSFSQLPNIVDDVNCILLGPQLGYKFKQFVNEYPANAHKMAVIDAMDFGMMDGEKILKNALLIVKQNNK